MKTVTVRWLGQRDYLVTWRAMRRFTETRSPETGDEIWLLEHPPVYTVGVRGGVHRSKHPHVDQLNGIPLIRTDRGGLVTYHGPGQLITYTLIDLARRNMSVRDLVSVLEKATLVMLKQYGIHAEARRDAPGVYVEGAKIASLGLRVRKFRSYHGLSLNVNLDLSPFEAIDPCGFRDLPVTRLADLGARTQVHEVAIPLLSCLMAQLKIDTITANLKHLPDEEIPHDQSA